MRCILSVLPLFLAVCVDASDLLYVAAICLLLLIVAAACFAFVYVGIYDAALDKLLEEGDYACSEKARSGWIGAISVGYWLLVTAVFLIYTFGPSGNGNPRYAGSSGPPAVCCMRRCTACSVKH